MRAAILEQAGKPLVIDDVTVADPHTRQVLMRTVACGLFHPDLHDLHTIIAERIPLDQIKAGFDKMKRGHSARSAIVFERNQ